MKFGSAFFVGGKVGKVIKVIRVIKVGEFGKGVGWWKVVCAIVVELFVRGLKSYYLCVSYNERQGCPPFWLR